MSRDKQGCKCPLLSNGVEHFMDMLEISILKGLCRQMKEENRVELWNYLNEERIERKRALSRT